jgi:hypothetical protein
MQPYAQGLLDIVRHDGKHQRPHPRAKIFRQSRNPGIRKSCEGPGVVRGGGDGHCWKWN